MYPEAMLMMKTAMYSQSGMSIILLSSPYSCTEIPNVIGEMDALGLFKESFDF